MVPLPISLLLLPRVPPQLPADTVHPVLAPAALRLHTGKGVPAGRDRHVVAGLQLEPLAAVKGRPRARARAVGDTDAQDDGVGKDDRPEGQRVRADGGHEHHRVLRVAERAACCEVVGGRAGGRRHADPVGKHRGEVLIVAEDFGVGHC